ncbi:Protein of unknown function [Pyronema omphalodes CBS 100304]|uniref:Uncharacterized protein n=1 Tax=Pyronema omphalodes (strain CBS 100304) TaxID=1076935 RepID=U4LK80_PYROM|nr:Protein of unknown function [Pyronema omphalodes CBS 100304]
MLNSLHDYSLRFGIRKNFTVFFGFTRLLSYSSAVADLHLKRHRVTTRLST